MSYGILIPGECKALIRQELRLLFGIHTGSIYPEIINLVEELSSKSRRLNTRPFTCKNELLQAVRQLDRELDYYLDYVLDQMRAPSRSMEQILMHIEHVIDSYRMGLLEFARDFCPQAAYLKPEDFENIIKHYNQSVQRFTEAMRDNRAGEFAGSALLIQTKED